MWESSYGVGKREAKIEIAKSLLDIETIALKTGLSVTEVENIKDRKL